MTIAKLLQAVPPPGDPVEPFIGSWESVEAYLGTDLPKDYKDIARLYGQGRFLKLVYINLPGNLDRRGTLEGELDLAREMVNYGMPVPYPAWPEPGGLLSIGLTDVNDRLFWLPQGEPADWRIVVWDRASQRLETFDCGLADFLVGLTTGEIKPEGFAASTVPSDPVFEPCQGPPGPAWPDWSGAVSGSRTVGRGIETLERIVRPPPKPYRPFTGPWQRVEAYLGTRLPQDYKDFARLYGSGLFLHTIVVHLPSIDDPRGTLEAQARDVSRAFSSDQNLPYPMWPRLGGLISFGVTENGDYLFWLPEGPPDNWKVVFWDRGLGEAECFEEFDCGLAEFLAGLVDGTILPKGHRKEDLEPSGLIFQPYSDEPMI